MKMTTPIWDFVKEYAELKLKSDMARLHMPGHKGRNFIGCELYDITEISGADELYAPDNIIQESECNASALYGSGYTAYSCEGSSQCIKAMIYLAVMNFNFNFKLNHAAGTRPVILAARNAHQSFLHAAALCDADIIWLYPENLNNIKSLCSCIINPENLKSKLKELKLKSRLPAAVYLTSPDYLGGLQDIKILSQIAHDYGVLVLIDNAHGAYLKFLENSRHPLDLGADMCCDSAHKTLPVLTGGAYLHISQQAQKTARINAAQVKQAMKIFGSTSPSWLILSSLDLCNLYLYQDYKTRLKNFISRLDKVKIILRENGWDIVNSDPLRITIRGDGDFIIKKLKSGGVEWEYADLNFVVLMATPENTPEDLNKIIQALGENPVKNNQNNQNPGKYQANIDININNILNAQTVMTPREALFAPSERIDIKNAAGRICAAPLISCPPAIPIAIAGELISRDIIDLFLYYGVREIDVVREI